MALMFSVANFITAGMRTYVLGYDEGGLGDWHLIFSIFACGTPRRSASPFWWCVWQFTNLIFLGRLELAEVSSGIGVSLFCVLEASMLPIV